LALTKCRGLVWIGTNFLACPCFVQPCTTSLRQYIGQMWAVETHANILVCRALAGLSWAKTKHAQKLCRAPTKRRAKKNLSANLPCETRLQHPAAERRGVFGRLGCSIAQWCKHTWAFRMSQPKLICYLIGWVALAGSKRSFCLFVCSQPEISMEMRLGLFTTIQTCLRLPLLYNGYAYHALTSHHT
jgi:hypothetical protein